MILDNVWCVIKLIVCVYKLGEKILCKHYIIFLLENLLFSIVALGCTCHNF